MVSKLGATRTVLFVDDQPEVTAALEMAFHKQPFSVRVANSAQEALGILTRFPVDAVVSDERMPGMTGSQFLSILRKQYPDIIRIVLSGQADPSAILAAINDAQAHHFLLKPCPPNEIASCVARAIDEREQKENVLLASRAQTQSDRVQSHRAFESALSSLWIAFQPIVRAADFELFAYEALVRSDQPGLDQPASLFAIAEESQCVDRLERAIRSCVGARAHGLPPGVQLMVNVTPSSLRDEDLYSRSSRLYPYRDRIILELTEREKLQELPETRGALDRIRDMGYRLALDDLGAGYAGLNSFAVIRPDVAKFDMELIHEIHLSSTKSNLVRSIASLCRDMGILTVAEGIETREECEAAVALGCDLLQGYYISRPSRVFAEREVLA